MKGSITGLQRAGRLALCGLAFLLAVPRPAGAAESLLPAGFGMRLPVEIQADRYESDQKSGVFMGVGNVRIQYQDIVLTCDELRVNTKTLDDLLAKGNVTLERGNLTWRCDEVTGNLNTRQFEVGRYNARSGQFYLSGNKGIYHGVHETETDPATGQKVRPADTREAELDHPVITTCDYTDPHTRATANRVVYYPDGTYKAYHVVYRVGWLPVFYLPYMHGTTGAAGMFSVKPGYNSKYGAFLLISKEFKISKEISTTFRLDLRTKNGVAVGNETVIETKRTYTDILFYGMSDNDAPDTGDGYNRRFKVIKDRYRAKIYNRSEITDDLTFRLKLDKMSDIDMLENWYDKEYSNNPQPKSFVDATLDWNRVSLSLSARPRVNDFYTEVEQLPVLHLTMPRQALGNSGFYYQSDSSIGKMEMRWRDFDKSRPSVPAGLTDPADYSALRADSLHMFYYPLHLGEFQVTPRAGGRLTYYSRTSKGAISTQDLENMAAVTDPDNPDTTLAVNSYDDQGGGTLRLAGETGFEVSTKYYRTWKDYKSTRWDIDGLRHVVQPYMNYTFAPKPSQDRENLYFFDEIDRLIEQNFVRLGLRQRAETRRSNRIYTLASLENYADFHFHNEEGFKSLGNFGTLAQYNPKETLSFWGRAVADMNEPTLNRAEVGVGFGNKKVLRTDVSYLYRNEYDARTVYSMGSSLADAGGDQTFAHHYDKSHYVAVEFNFPINAKTDGLVRYEFDILETRMARQVYEIQRDLHCWKGSFRIEEANGDVSFIVAFYLKAFPGFRLDSSSSL